jgi:L-methionine (R)-S-oxide reductase
VAEYLFPAQKAKTSSGEVERLLLGPFSGKPACQVIGVKPGKARGVCAEAYLSGQTVIVPDVEKHPSHIACDGSTKSEIVCPLIYSGSAGQSTTLGVLDLDCLALDAFDHDDKEGLEKLAALVVERSVWFIE